MANRTPAQLVCSTPCWPKVGGPSRLTLFLSGSGEGKSEIGRLSGQGFGAVPVVYAHSPDLIESTPWQIFLTQQLNYLQPHYAHLPILVNKENQKLSKQTFAKEINTSDPVGSLLIAYNYLGQKPFSKIPKTTNAFWNHAIKHWDINKVPQLKSIQV